MSIANEGADLPAFFVEAAGYTGLAPSTWVALWTGEAPAAKDDIQLLPAGWDVVTNTLKGILDPAWDAPQYADQIEKIKRHKPWETEPRWGGRGSKSYKFQHIPDHEGHGVIAAYPRWFVYSLSGNLVRAEGGEPIYKEDYDDPDEYGKVVDLDWAYDEDAAVYRLT